MRIAIIALNNCYGSSLHGLADVFVVANAHIAKMSDNCYSPITWKFFAVTPTHITLSSGLEVQLPVIDECIEKFDVIFIPGVLYKNAREFNHQLKKLRNLFAWLNEQHTNGALICANCTSTFVLGECGLLKGKRATTVWWLAHLFKKRFPDVRLDMESLLIEDNRVITAGSATSHFQLGIRLLHKYLPASIVQRVAKTILVDNDQSSVSPNALLISRRDHNNDLVQKAQDWIDTRIDTSFTLKELADSLNTTEKNITRNFKLALSTTPLKYIQQLRVQTARYLLETSTLPLEKVMDKVGYSDRSGFTKLFTKHMGLPPINYRRQYQLGRL